MAPKPWGENPKTFSVTAQAGGTLSFKDPDGDGVDEGSGGGGGTGFTGTNGETITLSGSGLDAIANPKPSAYDNFNEYSSPSDGMLVPTGGGSDNWGTSKASNADYELDSANPLPGRTYSAKSQGPKCALEGAKARADGPGRSNNEYYGTYWLYFNESLASPPQNDPFPRSDKIFRVWDSGDGLRTRVSWEGPAKLAFYNKQGDLENDYIEFEYPPTTHLESPNDSQWHRVDLYLNATTGEGSVWIDGKKHEYFTFQRDPTAASSDKFHTDLVGYDASVSADLTSTLRQWIAEFYEQPTIARVELSNSSAYDESVAQTRYYQKTLSRSDTEIQFEGFYGDLDTSAAVYAHVVKTDGTVIDWGQIN